MNVNQNCTVILFAGEEFPFAELEGSSELLGSEQKTKRNGLNFTLHRSKNKNKNVCLCHASVQNNWSLISVTITIYQIKRLIELHYTGIWALLTLTLVLRHGQWALLKIPAQGLEFKIITWRTFNLEYFFVYEFESKFLSNCILCVCSSIKKWNKSYVNACSAQGII